MINVAFPTLNKENKLRLKVLSFTWKSIFFRKQLAKNITNKIDIYDSTRRSRLFFNIKISTSLNRRHFSREFCVLRRYIKMFILFMFFI